jgi:hypothetical protein
MDLKTKFPLPIPDLWANCLEVPEIAYMIAFSLGVKKMRLKESPLGDSYIEDIESNIIDLKSASGNSGYYGIGILPIDDNIEMKSIFFDATASSKTRGSYRRATYHEPAEFPEVILTDIDLEGINGLSSDGEKSLDTKEKFGNRPDFSYSDFIHALLNYVQETVYCDDTDMSYEDLPPFPISIIKKIEKYVKSPEFLDSIVKNIEKIESKELEKAIKVFDLDMQKYRGKISGRKFNL